MSTTTTSATEVQPRSGPLATVLSVGAVCAALGSLGYISMNSADSAREAFLHPVNVAGCALATLGALLLSLGLVCWRTELPRWAVLTSAAGIWFVGANAWFFGTGILTFASVMDDAAFAATTFGAPWVIVMTAPKAVLCLVGFLGLAVAGGRRRILPRSAAIILGLAAVLSVWPPFPPGLILTSLAIFLIGRAGVAARS